MPPGVCYSGNLGGVTEVLAPIRALPDPIFDLLHEQPYVQEQSCPDGADPNGNHYYWKWIRTAWRRRGDFSTGGNYINLQTANEGEQRIRATYRANFGRLMEVKKAYDPDNLFRVNRNVSPSA